MDCKDTDPAEDSEDRLIPDAALLQLDQDTELSVLPRRIQ